MPFCSIWKMPSFWICWRFLWFSKQKTKWVEISEASVILALMHTNTRNSPKNRIQPRLIFEFELRCKRWNVAVDVVGELWFELKAITRRARESIVYGVCANAIYIWIYAQNYVNTMGDIQPKVLYTLEWERERETRRAKRETEIREVGEWGVGWYRHRERESFHCIIKYFQVQVNSCEKLLVRMSKQNTFGWRMCAIVCHIMSAGGVF